MIVLIDTRENTPFQFREGVETESATLPTGDYSIKGLENHVAIERKSLPDLIGCITVGRDRFERELHRLQAYRCRAVVISADVQTVYDHGYRSQVKPSSVLGSIAAWHVRYNIPFVWSGENGADQAYRIMRAFWMQCERFNKVMQSGQETKGR